MPKAQAAQPIDNTAAATQAPAPAAPAAAAPAETKTLYDMLPTELQKVNTALDGLCGVLFGDGFKHDDIWGAGTKILDADIETYLKGLKLKEDIKSTLDQVRSGINKVPPLKTAVDKMIEGLGLVVDVINKGKVEVGKAQEIVNPVIDLSTKLLPAVSNVVKEATGTDITDEVQTALDFIKGAQAVARLGFYAAGVLAALQVNLQAA
jgi:hypothetical protein